MEGAAEKMEAMKRAYADIILNTAKDAASRVLAADRRAVQLERNLSMAKEESLAVLLRVKIITDAKIKEAEKVKLSQARKIHELQIKLREAKDTIYILKSELKKLHAELENKKSKNAKGGAIENANIKHPALSQKGKVGNCCFMKSPTQTDSLKVNTSNACAGKPDLGSIILTNKERDSYRNGCTQRIRAFEHNLLTRREHLAVSDEQLPKMDSKTLICRNGTGERYTAENSMPTNETSQLKAPLNSKEIERRSNIRRNDHAVKVCSWRRRRRMQRKHIMKPRSFHALSDMAIVELINGHHSTDGQQSDMARCADIMNARTSEVSQESPNSNFSQTSMEDVKSSKNTSIELKESLNCQTSGLPTRQIVTDLCRTSLESHIGVGMKSNIRNTIEEDNQNKLLLFTLIDMNDISLSDEGIKQDINGEKVVENSRLTDRDCNTVVELVTTQKENQDAVLEFRKEGSRDGEPCITMAQPAKDPIDNIVKYTRKRRRGSLEAKNKTVSLEENYSPRRDLEVEDHLVEPQRTSLVIDSSSRDSRRLVQVARQLISLSEKRW